MKVEGFRDIERALAELKASTAKGVLRRVGRKALEPVRETAARLAPVDTGGLGDSIIIAGTQKGGAEDGKIPGIPENRKSQVRLYVGPTTSFGHRGSLQEFGTFKDPGTPFLRPAWDAHRRDVLNIIVSELRPEIERTAARAARRAAKGK